MILLKSQLSRNMFYISNTVGFIYQKKKKQVYRVNRKANKHIDLILISSW